MKASTLNRARFAAAIITSVFSLVTAVPAHAYKYQFTTQADGLYGGNFTSMDELFDNGVPDVVGPYSFRTTAWLNDPVDTLPYGDGKSLRFNEVKVKIELIQNGVTYETVRVSNWSTISYNPFGSGSDYGSLTFNVRTTPDLDSSSLYPLASITSYMQIFNLGAAFSNILTPGFSASAEYSSFNSNTHIEGYTEDWIGTTGAFYEDPSKITWQVVSTIPEPSSYAMMMLGGAVLAGAGSMLRRRESAA